MALSGFLGIPTHLLYPVRKGPCKRIQAVVVGQCTLGIIRLISTLLIAVRCSCWLMILVKDLRILLSWIMRGSRPGVRPRVELCVCG